MVLYRRYWGVSSRWVSADHRWASVFDTLILTRYWLTIIINMLLILLALPGLIYLRLPIYSIGVKHISKSPHRCSKILGVMPFPVTLSSSKFSTWTLKNKYKINFCINYKALKSEYFFYKLCDKKSSAITLFYRNFANLATISCF